MHRSVESGEGEREGKEESFTLSFEQIKFGRPLADRTLTAQVFKARIGSKSYAVKLFAPFSTDSLEINRARLRRYKLSDAELENRFYPWRREIRVYEHIDKYIQGSKRKFFPKYYGATKLHPSLCPNGNTEGAIIVLELLNGIEIHNEDYALQISDLTLQVAKELCKEGLNVEYIHTYVHCMEKIEALHDVKVVHGDVKPDIFMNSASVMCDFSHAWSWNDDNEPCLDPFRPRHGPISFEVRSKGEREHIKDMVITEYNDNNPTKRLQFEGYTPRFYLPGKRTKDELRNRVPSWQDCSRCRKTISDIVSLAGPVEKGEMNSSELRGTDEKDSHGQGPFIEPTDTP